MSLTYKQQQALKRMKVRLPRTDLRRYSLERLKEEFSTARGNRIVYARLIRSIVYQAATWMQRGKVPKVEGNLRSLFYQWVKPVFAKIPGALSSNFDPYAEMLDVLEIFITELKLFKYRDLEVIDGNWDKRWFGSHPHILLFAEKDGFILFLKEAHREYDITTLSLGGAPSHLSSEYLVEGLHEKFDTIPPLVLLSIVDYDPSGLSIEQAFKRQLEKQGLEISELITFIHPESYSPEELEIFRFPVPFEYKKRLENWMDATGGLDGQPFGLEADSMPKTKLRQLLRQALSPFL